MRSITGETIVPLIRAGLKRMYSEGLPSFNPLKYTEVKEDSPPVHAGATVKMLLSQMPSPGLMKWVGLISLEKVAPDTISDHST